MQLTNTQELFWVGASHNDVIRNYQCKYKLFSKTAYSKGVSHNGKVVGTRMITPETDARYLSSFPSQQEQSQVQQCVQLRQAVWSCFYILSSSSHSISAYYQLSCDSSYALGVKANIHSAFFFYIFQISCDDENRKYYFKYNYHTFLSKRTRVGKRFSQKLYSYSHKCIKSGGKCENYGRPSSGGCVSTLPYRHTALCFSHSTFSSNNRFLSGDIADGRLLA